MASGTSQPQQIAVTDLDLPQLSDVKRQLEEVGEQLDAAIFCVDHSTIFITGIDAPHKFVHSTEAGPSKVQVLYRECARNKASEHRYDHTNPRSISTNHLSGKTILVPLTNSLYVPGKLSDPENVIIDIGTGYYVKKVRVSALDGCLH